jgi:hypothetical protein
MRGLDPRIHHRVMPALVAGIHALSASKTWMAGTSPAMTKRNERISGSNPAMTRVIVNSGRHETDTVWGHGLRGAFDGI